MDVLDQLRIGENTPVIVASENGSLLGFLKFCKPEGTAKITNGHKSIGSWCGKKGGAERVATGFHSSLVGPVKLPRILPTNTPFSSITC